MEVLRVDYEGAKENVIDRIAEQINEMQQRAVDISSCMEQLPVYWSGDAYNRAEGIYQEEYKKYIEQELPEKLEDFKCYMHDCLNKLKEADQMLGGN